METKIEYNTGYSSEEKETSLSFDYISKKWYVFSTVPRHIKKILSICENEREKENGAFIRKLEYDSQSKEKRIIMVDAILPFESNVVMSKKPKANGNGFKPGGNKNE